MFFDDMSFLSFVTLIFALTHVLVAIFASVALSSIPRQLYNRKLHITFLTWVVPFFGVMIFYDNGKHVPPLGGQTYQSALEQASKEFDAEVKEKEMNKSINHNDSRYGGQSGGYDGGDGGGD